MNRLLLICLLCGAASFAIAQNNRVGIGTTTPQAQLHTTGSVRFDTLKGSGIRPVYANSDGVLVTVGVPISNTVAMPITDYSCAGITSTVAVTGQGNAIPSANIRVTLNIAHNTPGDLFVYLISPAGQILNLAYHEALLGGINFTNTIFSDAATQSVTTGSGPFSGTYRPNGTTATVGSAPVFAGATVIACSYAGTVSSFAALGSGSIVPNGTWTLKVIDGYQDYTGTLNSWSIGFSPTNAPVASNYVVKAGGAEVFTASSIYDNGKVGIGTSNPLADLDLLGDTLGIRSTAGSWDNLWFYANDSTASINASGAEGGLNFRVGSNTTGTYGNGQTLTTAMTLLPNGRIGIGTKAPFSQLSNTTKNTIGADANGGNPGSFSWAANQGGYVSQFFNEGNFGSSNGLAVKVLNSTATAFDVSQGTQESAGLPLFNVKANGRIGIGTNNPAVNVDIIGGTSQQIMRIAGGRGQTDNNGLLIIQDSSNNTAANGNNELIFFINAANNIMGSITRVANANSIAFNTTSDTRLKSNIHPTRYGLNDLLAIQVADYQYRGISNATPQTGFLAQQLYTIYPEAVTKGNDANEKQPYMVDYSKLTPLLVKALQDMNSKVEGLQQQVKTLQQQNEALQAGSRQYEEVLTQLKAMQQALSKLQQ